MSATVQKLTQAQRSARTRERLIAAAINALYRFGYAATSTTLVADLAGVSRGAMLHQFASKALLMSAVMESIHQGNMDAYRAALNGRDLTPEQRLLTLLDVAWLRHSSPDGVAQNEIWAATRSDAELSELVTPIQMAHVEETRAAHARMMAAVGVQDRAVSDALITMNVAALRGLESRPAAIAPRAARSPRDRPPCSP